MRSLRDSAGCDGKGDLSGEDKAFEPFVGWEEEAEDLEEKYKIINIANSKINLLKIIDNYSISMLQVYAGSGWNYKSVCPFHFHKGGSERTPSFGVNPNINRFHCFGCGASGGPIEFIAYMDRRAPIGVAKDILGSLGYLEDALEAATNESENLGELLYEFSSYVRGFITQHENSELAIKFAENIMWSFDLYIFANVAKSSIFVEELMARIEKHKEMLDSFGDPG